MTEPIASHTETIQKAFYELRSAIEKSKDRKIDIYSKPHSNEISELRDLETSVYNFRNFMESATCNIANNPFVVIIGEAGVGKSHLLADLVKLRKEDGSLSLLLLGENFSTLEMPWTQLLQNQIRKNIDEFVFLGALSAKAECLQKRIVIMIDALMRAKAALFGPKD